VVSRPIVLNAYQVVFFTDLSTGNMMPGDYQLNFPEVAGLIAGTFAAPRMWWADEGQIMLYNQIWAPTRLHQEDLLGTVVALDSATGLGLRAIWLPGPPSV